MTKILESSSTTSMPMTWSPARKRIPRTPRDTRPIGRASFSWKRMAWPSEVEIRISFSPVVMRIQRSSSPSSKLMAIKPLCRTFWYCSNGVFLTTPRTVHMNKWPVLSCLLMFKIELTVSSGCSCNKLTSATPLAFIPTAGTS